MDVDYSGPEGVSGYVVVIQPDWLHGLKNKEKIWTYHKKTGEVSTHGFLEDGNFKKISQQGRTIKVQFRNTSPMIFVSPIELFTELHTKSVMCLDVSSGGLGVSVSADSKRIIVWDTQNGVRRRGLEGHVFDPYHCRFFPSGVVVLSGGADMQLKIWDAATGNCPITLKGHTSSVTDTSVVDKGRNVISVSKDGTTRLWNVAQSKCINILLQADSNTCCDIIDVSNIQELYSEGEQPQDELEFCTENKILAVGCEDGKIYLIRVCSREVLATHVTSSAVHCMRWVSNRLIVGLEDGKIVSLNIKKYGEVPQILSHDSASAVLCVAPLCTDGFIVGRRDGLCQYYSSNGENKAQLTGPDCDPVYSVAQDGHFIYTACRDKIIRKYRISDMRL